MTMNDEEQARLMAPVVDVLSTVEVYPLIPAIKKDIISTIDSPLSWDQLTASDINFSIVRPLVFKYAKKSNLAVVYTALVVRSHFLGESEDDMAYAGILHSRAMLCEILAMKLLSHFASDYLQLVSVLTTTWNPLSAAPASVVEEIRDMLGGTDDVLNYPQSALEMAISTEAKHFISSPVTQKVVNDIYSGRVVYSVAAGSRSILSDNFKPRPIEIYQYRNTFLDHYRLRVPRYASMIEFVSFAFLLATFVLCLANQDKTMINFWEYLFIVEALAFTLDEYIASSEHGWSIYFANVWNVFDTSFILVVFLYLGFRLNGLVYNNVESSELGFDILACGACILFPRLAFFAVSNTVVVLSLRAMISEFVFFIGIAGICFSGLLFTLWTLGKEHWTVKAIAWLMVQIWFGNTYLSFGQAESFHPIFGPILMTMFAALSNTLLLTILISILSNTVARIDANATQEHLFQFSIITIEGVKSDALFSYQPPFNVLAFLILKPASWILSPRALHSLNVLLIKLTSFPFLIVIALYERYFASGQAFRESSRGAAQTIISSLPRHIKNIPFMDALIGSNSSNLYDAIFEVDTAHDDLHDESDDGFPPLRSFASRDDVSRRTVSPSPRARRRPSSSRQGSPRGSPRMRTTSNLFVDPAASAELSSGGRSPLARLFNRSTAADAPATYPTNVEASVRKIEHLVDDIRDLPIHKLRDDIKELQDRQARIENLLLMLTRGMRNEPVSRRETQSGR